MSCTIEEYYKELDEGAKQARLHPAYWKEARELTGYPVLQEPLQAPSRPFIPPVRSREQEARWKAFCARSILS